MSLQQILARCLVQASADDMEDVSTMRCLRDERSQRNAQKLFKEHCGGKEEDMSLCPAFIQELDKLLCKYGGGKRKGEDNDVDEE